MEGARPVASPDDDKVIVSSCESTPYCIQSNVKKRDHFWIKKQPFSLVDMLARDELVDQFVGGSIYQVLHFFLLLSFFLFFSYLFLIISPSYSH